MRVQWLLGRLCQESAIAVDRFQSDFDSWIVHESLADVAFARSHRSMDGNREGPGRDQLRGFSCSRRFEGAGGIPDGDKVALVHLKEY